MTEPARVVGHISASQPWGERESPIEHVANTAANAIDDLNKTIFMARTQRELVLLKELTQALIAKLETSWSTAHTLDTHFYEMRGK